MKPRTFCTGALLKLYYFPSSSHCLKVRAVAYELDVHLELTASGAKRMRSLKRALADARQSLQGMYRPPVNGDAGGA